MFVFIVYYCSIARNKFMRTDNKSKLKKNKTTEKSPLKQKPVSEGFEKFIHIFETSQSCANINKVPSGLRDLYEFLK